MDQTESFFKQILLYKGEFFDSGPDGRYQSCGSWEKMFEYEDIS